MICELVSFQLNVLFRVLKKTDSCLIFVIDILRSPLDGKTCTQRLRQYVVESHISSNWLCITTAKNWASPLSTKRLPSYCLNVFACCL